MRILAFLAPFCIPGDDKSGLLLDGAFDLVPVKMLKQIVPAWWRQADSKAFGDLAGQSSRFQVTHSPGARGMLAQLLLVIQVGLFQGGQQLVIFAAALLSCRGALFARHGEAAVSGQGFDCLGEFLVIKIHHKTQGISGGATAEAVIELFLRLYAEGGRFFLVKGAAGRVIFAGFAQLDAFVDDVDDIYPAKQVINKVLRNQTSHGRCTRK